jgi:outer membrane protein OmpA-like peptidoglycan-associated protein
MLKTKFTYYVLIFFLICFSLAANAQKKNFKKADVVKLDLTNQASLRFYKEYAFPNVNKVPYYFDKKQLDAIKKYEQKKDWEKLYKVLKGYVKKFGIQNFYKDTYYLWRLAKLTELYGDEDEAKFLYKLALKHHRNDIEIQKIELHYDSINQPKKDLYVPLDYYYELVEFRLDIDTLRPPRGVLLNMGNLINSQQADYAPTLGANDNVLLFTSRRKSERKNLNMVQREDLFFSRKVGDTWTKAEELKHINTKYNEGSGYLSKDGNSLFFARCDSPDSYGNCDIFVSELKADSTWGAPKNLGPNVNSIGWDSHPSLSPSGDTLYFASDRIGGFGLSDIYYTYQRADGSWAPALNAGPIINTRHNEVSPFIHPVYDVLFFSSNGHILNFGEFDIYKSYRVNGKWGEPKNIGPLINGKGSEFYFTIDMNSRYLYYSKSKGADLNTDLFSFPLPMEARPDANTKFSGSLTDSLTGKPYSGIVSIIDLDNGVEVAPKFLRSDGTFEFDLINNNNYLIIIQGDEFFRIEEMFYLDGDTEFHKTTDPISSKIKFESIEFENGKAELLPEMYGDLIKVASFLIDNPDFRLKISGHTDSDGNDDFNLNLSRKRADAIRDYIVHFNNVEDFRVVSEGFGNSKPIIKDEKTEDDKRMNRRVEFEIYRPGKEELDQIRKEREKKMQSDWD